MEMAGILSSTFSSGLLSHQTSKPLRRTFLSSCAKMMMTLASPGNTEKKRQKMYITNFATHHNKGLFSQKMTHFFFWLQTKLIWLYLHFQSPDNSKTNFRFDIQTQYLPFFYCLKKEIIHPIFQWWCKKKNGKLQRFTLTSMQNCNSSRTWALDFKLSNFTLWI